MFLESQEYFTGQITPLPNVISVDAPDGSGKSNFVKVLVQRLQSKFPETEVMSIAATNFYGSEGSRKQGKLFQEFLSKNLNRDLRRRNSFFLEATRANYLEMIIPFAASGKVIVLDSSEIRNVAFVLDRGDSRTISSTRQCLSGGYMTAGCCPSTRILLRSSMTDCYQNLICRKKRAFDDPQDYNGVVRRFNSYDQGVDYLKRLKTSEPVSWIEVVNPRVDLSGDELEKYLSDIIKNQVIKKVENQGKINAK